MGLLSLGGSSSERSWATTQATGESSRSSVRPWYVGENALYKEVEGADGGAKEADGKMKKKGKKRKRSFEADGGNGSDSDWVTEESVD